LPSPLLELDQASIFFAGQIHEPQLNHPEGIAVGDDGDVWCGGTAGEVYRLPADGSRLERVTDACGYSLGLAFDRDGLLYVCDLKGRTVKRLDPVTCAVEDFVRYGGDRRLVTPNFPVVDHTRHCLYVSDSNVAHEPGGGVWRIDLATGLAEPWWDQPLDFANGLAFDAQAQILYVAESWGQRINAVPLGDDGAPRDAQVIVEGFEGIVDGIALADDGTLYLAFYAPSQIARVVGNGELEIVIRDDLCDVLCHPTNIAWSGRDLLAANFGAHHLTRIPLDVTGRSLL
jgi:sugar lactone lactonase YvrE